MVIDIKEYERLIAKRKLQEALDEGERSGTQDGWMSAAEARVKYEV